MKEEMSEADKLYEVYKEIVDRIDEEELDKEAVDKGLHEKTGRI